MKKKTIQRKKISKECWCLDATFLKWLQEHLEVFLHDANKIIDWHSSAKVEYLGEHYCVDELIKRMLHLLNIANNWRYHTGEEYDKAVNEILDIWKAVFNYMWW